MTAPHYTIKRDGAQWLVLDLSGRVQFRSLRRANCRDWVNDNTQGEDTSPV